MTLPNMVDNRASVNYARLQDVVTISRRTIDLLINVISPDGVSKPKNIKEFNDFNENVKLVVTKKLREKFAQYEG